jgi:heme exporter protein C
MMSRRTIDSIFLIVMLLGAALFAYAPFRIVAAPYEATMGLVQKIFYFHVGAAITMFAAAFTCGIASAIFLFANRPAGDRIAFAAAEITVLFGLVVLISGPLWGRKSWGVWWQWDARLTLALIVWITFVAYLLLRRYGGPGSEKLAAGVGIFGMANIPFVYQSVNWWRTVHPKTTVVSTLKPGMYGTFWLSTAAFMLLMLVLLMARARLERERAALDALYLETEE